jgi:aromatic ring-opening dioxygenase catalytic subunit (LigB family)
VVSQRRDLPGDVVGPAARQAHPREEHLLPLMVVAGAAGDDAGKVDFAAKVMGLRVSGYHFG